MVRKMFSSWLICFQNLPRLYQPKTRGFLLLLRFLYKTGFTSLVFQQDYNPIRAGILKVHWSSSCVSCMKCRRLKLPRTILKVTANVKDLIEHYMIFCKLYLLRGRDIGVIIYLKFCIPTTPQSISPWVSLLTFWCLDKSHVYLLIFSLEESSLESSTPKSGGLASVLFEKQLVYVQDHSYKRRSKIQDLWNPIIDTLTKAPTSGGSVYTVAPLDI